MTTSKNGVLLQGVKSGLLCFVLGTVGVLLVALLAKLMCLSDTLVNVLAVVLGAVAVFVGTLMSVRDCAFVPKALVGALLYVLLNLATSLIADGTFSFATTGLNALTAFAAGVLAALIKSRR